MHQLLRRARLGWIAIVLWAVLLPRLGVADDIKPLPPDGTFNGMTLSDWAVAWAQWHESIPVSVHPAPELDPTGQRAGVGQHAPVWFVPPVGAGTSGTRSFVVPEGQAILIALAEDSINAEPGKMTDVQLQILLTKLLPKPPQLELNLDGVAVPDPTAYHVRTPVFSISLPPDNIHGIDVSHLKDPRLAAVYDGYFALFPPLPIGDHVFSVRRQGSDYKGEWTFNVRIQKPNEPLQ